MKYSAWTILAVVAALSLSGCFEDQPVRSVERAAAPPKQDENAIAALESAGVFLQKNAQGVVTNVRFDEKQVTDDNLKHLVGLVALDGLMLKGTEIDDAQLEHLAGLKRLNSLTLSETAVTDAGLVHLSGLVSLRYLYLDETKVGDIGLSHLKTLNELDYLWLSGTPVTDAGIVMSPPRATSQNSLALVAASPLKTTSSSSLR